MKQKYFLRTSIPLYLTVAASGQTVHWQHSGQYGDGALGSQAVILGDLDGDGFDDVAFGDPHASPLLFLDGQILVLSGQTGAVLHTINPLITSQGLGTDVAAAGDVDGDGVPDLIAASDTSDPEVYSGATGQLIAQLSFILGTSSGQRVAGIDDVNGDGFDDVAVSVPYATVASIPNTGRVQIVSGAFITNQTGPAYLQTWTGSAGGDHFGRRLKVYQDLDGDSLRDVLVCAPGETGQIGPQTFHGAVHVLSSATGQTLQTIRWFGTAGEFGHEVIACGDLNQDGFEEIAVGNPYYDGIGAKSGRVHVYSGIDGTVLYTVLGTSAWAGLGWSLSAGGDTGGDGFPDLLIGAIGDEGNDGQDGGAVWILSGKNGTVQTIVDLEGGGLGSAVAGPADFDGDSIADFVAGAGSHDGVGRVYALLNPCLGDLYSYCTAAPNSASALGGSITASGSTSVAAQDLTLLARNCPPSRPGLFFYGTTQIFALVGDGRLCTGGDIRRLYPVQTIDPSGMASLSLDWTSSPVSGGSGAILPGLTKNFSFWFRDPGGGPAGFNYTNAVSVTFCL